MDLRAKNLGLPLEEDKEKVGERNDDENIPAQREREREKERGVLFYISTAWVWAYGGCFRGSNKKCGH